MSAQLLLVDDDMQLLDTARDILEDAGYEVHTALTVAQGLERLAASSPAILVVDLNLKDGNGLELARQARTTHAALKIILMTGEASVDLSPAQGAIDQCLLKPVHPQDLLETLKRLI